MVELWAQASVMKTFIKGKLLQWSRPSTDNNHLDCTLTTSTTSMARWASLQPSASFFHDSLLCIGSTQAIFMGMCGRRFFLLSTGGLCTAPFLPVVHSPVWQDQQKGGERVESNKTKPIQDGTVWLCTTNYTRIAYLCTAACIHLHQACRIKNSKCTFEYKLILTVAHHGRSCF